TPPPPRPGLPPPPPPGGGPHRPDRLVAPDATEEGEYAALLGAADASAALLEGPGRRVVVVAELDDAADPDGKVVLQQVVAVHADVEDRAPDADPDEDLAWFATQEIPFLIGC
uniref:DUF6912 family protein n=1 Tax=Nocardioides sp. SYSU DS0663 TaxID=3416445 RepID=UPI003F4BC3BF